MNDLISRQAAIDALRTHERKPSKKWFDNQLDIEWNNAIDICCYDIEDLPSAQPERIKGHWIDAVIPNDSGGLPVIVCDKCNTFFPLQFGASHNFCPNCGADMRGEQDE